MASQFLVSGTSAYSTSKLAMLRFSVFTNVEDGAEGILEYSVHPGAVPTELATDVMPKAMASALWIDTLALSGNTIRELDMEELFSMKDEIVEKDLRKVRMVVE
ncbi:MAG: hypothetical protein Q9226_002338 [Calogaya cf. arnoldii]